MSVNRMDQIEIFHQNIKRLSDIIGNLLVNILHYLSLFAIMIAITWSVLIAYTGMIEDQHVSIEDILLLFIYLELLAMVGIYFKTNHMPVRFLIYVAITALTRMLIGHIQVDHKPDIETLIITGAILVLALSTLVIRYGSYKYPSDDKGHDTSS